MNIWKTDKDRLSSKEIIEYIKKHETEVVPKYNELWAYYIGKNPTILARQKNDFNNPDNRTPVSYGRKIVTTYVGYGYRPGYITYKSENAEFIKAVKSVFSDNNENIKTSQHGRNTAVFGVSYELAHLAENKNTNKSEFRFSVVDPREVVLLYDISLEPTVKIGIRYYPISNELVKVSVYYHDKIEHYEVKRESGILQDKLEKKPEETHYFSRVPIIAFYKDFGDIMGIIEPVKELIDDYDFLVSDSMNEFDRFAHAYLKLVKMSLTDMAKVKSPGNFIDSLFNIKKRRVFENLPDKDAVSFLTKDIPTEYIDFMTRLIRDQIHIQSHVPDLGSDAFKDGISGVAVQRLMFDFENVVSSAEAQFDMALMERIMLLASYFKITSRATGDYSEITISHKRNTPLNVKEFADTAKVLKETGFSMKSIIEYMPDDLYPDVEKELKLEEEERQETIPDIETMFENTNQGKTVNDN